MAASCGAGRDGSDCVKDAVLEGRGRGLVAARKIAPGEVVLQESPVLRVVDEELTKSCCALCFRLGSPLIPCPHCSECWYCNTHCLDTAIARRIHSPATCCALSSLQAATPGLRTEGKNSARFVIAAYALLARDSDGKGDEATEGGGGLEKEQRGEEVSAEGERAFDAVMALDGEGVANKTAEVVHDLVAKTMGPYLLPTGSRQLTLSTTASLLAKDDRNTYAHMAPSGMHGARRVRGYACYVRASLFNHDCLPNACRFDYVDRGGDGSLDITIRALHEIEEGSEVCLSYFPVNTPYEERQGRLLGEYGFVCDCLRCRIEAHWSDEDESGEEGDEECGSGDDQGEGEEVMMEGDEGDSASRGGRPKGARDVGKGPVAEPLNQGEGGSSGTVRANGKGREVSGKGKEEQEEEEEGESEGDGESDRGGGEGGEDDFAHAEFFVRYLCPVEDCGGTMAPLPGTWKGSEGIEGGYVPSGVMECNMCGHLRTEEEYEDDLRQHGML